MVKLALNTMAPVFHVLILDIKIKIVQLVIQQLMKLVELVVDLSFNHVILDLHMLKHLEHALKIVSLLELLKTHFVLLVIKMAFIPCAPLVSPDIP